MPHAIDAARGTLTTRAGTLTTYIDDRARSAPVLLLHATGPLGCAYEMAPLFDALRAERTVIAVELPGYGAHPVDVAAAPAPLAAVVEEIIEEVALRHGELVDVVATRHTGLAAAMAVGRTAKHVRSLVVVSPPEAAPLRLGRALAQPLRRACAVALAAPVLGAAVHRVATSRVGLEVLLRRRAKRTPYALMHHAWFSARQEGAHLARVEALRAALAARPERTLPAVPVPTLVVLGAGEVPDGVLCSPLATAGRTLAVVPETVALPHVERPVETAAALRSFWATLRSKPALRLVRGQGQGQGQGRAPARRGALRDVAPDGARRR
jgi:pimeloyl-ACP methyl ester carboxylesterase